MTNISIPPETWANQVQPDTHPPTSWIWHGFIAHANITLLTSQWKAGKTTLLAMLLARRNSGGQLAGLAVRPGKTVVVSEEPISLWAERIRRYHLGSQVCLLSQPFQSVARPDQWQALLDRLLDLHRQHTLDLAVFDPLALFCPNENHSTSILEMLLPLAALKRQGLAILLLHHPAKGQKPLGQAARGSGALLGHVDIALEMRHPGCDPATRRRRFLALSRHPETTRQLLAELNADATDYLPLPDPDLDDFHADWQIVRMVLEDAPQKLTCLDILQDWPPDFRKPHSHTLWRWLSRAVQLNLVSRDGAGRKYDPFRYWLPECEQEWKRRDPFYQLKEDQRRFLAHPPHKFDADALRARFPPQDLPASPAEDGTEQ